MTERWKDGRMCEVDDNLEPSLILIRATERGTSGTATYVSGV
jgi:hypothetical protein